MHEKLEGDYKERMNADSNLYKSGDTDNVVLQEVELEKNENDLLKQIKQNNDTLTELLKNIREMSNMVNTDDAMQGMEDQFSQYIKIMQTNVMQIVKELQGLDEQLKIIKQKKVTSNKTAIDALEINES